MPFETSACVCKQLDLRLTPMAQAYPERCVYMHLVLSLLVLSEHSKLLTEHEATVYMQICWAATLIDSKTIQKKRYDLHLRANLNNTRTCIVKSNSHSDISYNITTKFFCSALHGSSSV